MPDDPTKFELSFDKYWGNYHFFYTIQQTLLSDVYNMFWEAFYVNIIDRIMYYIIWACMGYYYVRSIFFQDWIMNWSNLLIVAPLKLFKCVLPSFIELLNKFILIFRIWLSPAIHAFSLCFVVLAFDCKEQFISNFYSECCFRLLLLHYMD